MLSALPFLDRKGPRRAVITGLAEPIPHGFTPSGAQVNKKGPHFFHARGCTDCLFLLLFIAWWMGMLAIAGVSWTFGQPQKLIYASDYKAQTCGMPTTGDNAALCGEHPVSGAKQACGKYATFPKLGEEIQDALASGQTDLMALSFYAVCVGACPRLGTWVCSYEMREFLDTTFPDTRDDDLETLSDAAIDALDACHAKKAKAGGVFGAFGLSEPCKTYLNAGCWKATITETDMFFRCLPLPENNNTCTESPYLKSRGVPGPPFMWPASNPQKVTSDSDLCGRCLDPPLQADGVTPTIPGSEACNSALVTSETASTVQQNNPIFDMMGGFVAVAQQHMADVKKTWWMILVAGGVPVENLQNTFSDRTRCICTATARVLIPAECSAVS